MKDKIVFNFQEGAQFFWGMGIRQLFLIFMVTQMQSCFYFPPWLCMQRVHLIIWWQGKVPMFLLHVFQFLVFIMGLFFMGLLYVLFPLPGRCSPLSSSSQLLFFPSGYSSIITTTGEAFSDLKPKSDLPNTVSHSTMYLCLGAFVTVKVYICCVDFKTWNLIFPVDSSKPIWK